MNIDVRALEGLASTTAVTVEDLLHQMALSIRNAYLEAHPGLDFRLRVNVDAASGDVEFLRVPMSDEGLPLLDEATSFDAEDFTPQAMTAARKALVQALRQAEDQAVFDKYLTHAGDILSGIVQADAFANERGVVAVNLDNTAGGQDGVLLPAEQTPGEVYPHGKRVKCYVVGVHRAQRGVEIMLSRTHPELVRRLFELEVPEVADGSVEIMGLAREAGHRTKMAVRSTVKGVNPKGACIGPKGQRVNNVSTELGDEKIDIVEYSEDPAVYVKNALAPSKVVSVEVVDERNKVARVVVPEYQLSLAIGKEGQNARLAARMTGWRIDIHSDAEDLSAIDTPAVSAAAAGETVAAAVDAVDAANATDATDEA